MHILKELPAARQALEYAKTFQDVPTSMFPRCQHNTHLRHTPCLLQTFQVIGKRPGYCAQPDLCAQIDNVAVLIPLGNSINDCLRRGGGGLATL